MFTSFPQYLLLAPSFTNVLNVYAFCNLHDVSWGTKGSDKADALPSISSKKGKDDEGAVVEDTAKLQEDVDAAFKETVTRAVTKVSTKEVVEKPTMDDQNKTFRTRLVGVWMLTNAGLSVAIANLNGLSSGDYKTDQQELQDKQQTYFAIILYSTFGLALVRFIGVSIFMCLYVLVVNANGYSSACSTSSNATCSGSAAEIRAAAVSHSLAGAEARLKHSIPRCPMDIVDTNPSFALHSYMDFVNVSVDTYDFTSGHAALRVAGAMVASGGRWWSRTYGLLCWSTSISSWMLSFE